MWLKVASADGTPIADVCVIMNGVRIKPKWHIEADGSIGLDYPTPEHGHYECRIEFYGPEGTLLGQTTASGGVDAPDEPR